MGHSRYFLPTAIVEIMLWLREETFLINWLKVTYTTSQWNDCATGCLLHYNYFKNHKMIAIDLSKQHAPDVDPKAIQQINFTGNLIGNNRRLIFFIVEEAKETNLIFSQGTGKVLKFYFSLIWCQYKVTQYKIDFKHFKHKIVWFTT